MVTYSSPSSPLFLLCCFLFSRCSWDSLLRCGWRVLGLSLSEARMMDFCDAMLRNNPGTGNFGSLMALTTAAINEARGGVCFLCVPAAAAIAAAAAVDRPRDAAIQQKSIHGSV